MVADVAAEDALTGVNAHSDGNTVIVGFSGDSSEFNCGETVTVTQSMSFETTTTVNCDPVITNNPYWSCEPLQQEFHEH